MARDALKRTSAMNGMAALAESDPLKTGDLVLFASSGSWLGRLWRRRPGWTHVGLVLRSPGDLEPLLWEAHGGLRHGTALAPLATRLARFAGKVGVRCLNRPLSSAQCQRLDALRQHLARPPEHGLLDLIAAADDGWLGARPEHLGEPTDAELVATAYQGLGLIDSVESGGPPPDRFRPRHFASGYGLELKSGYALGPEIVLQEPAQAAGWSNFRPQPV
jgi:hypothetical protein